MIGFPIDRVSIKALILVSKFFFFFNFFMCARLTECKWHHFDLDPP